MGEVQGKHSQSAEIAKYTRFMEVGMWHVLAIPTVWMVSVKLGFSNLTAVFIVILAIAGVMWLAIGKDGRDRLKAQQEKEDGINPTNTD